MKKEEDIFRRRNWRGKREAENEIDKLLSRKKKKQETTSEDDSSKRPTKVTFSNNGKLASSSDNSGSSEEDEAKVVATSSKNGVATRKTDSSSEEDVPIAKNPPVNGSAAASKKDAYSSDGSSSEDDSTSAEEDVAVKKAPAAASEKEESSDESSDVSSSEDDSSSAEEDAVIEKASVAASEKEESSDESSSDDDEPDAAQPTKVKKTSDTSEETDSDEDDSDSNADKGNSVAVSKKNVESSGDSCGEESEEKVPRRVSSSHRRARKQWKEFLIGIFYEELVIHEKDFNQLDWGGIVQKLYRRTGKQSGVIEVQTLYKKFRDETKQFMDLLQVTGFEWNPHNNKVTCKAEVWEDIYWIHGGEKLFRNKGLLHYNLLRDIFGTGVQESDVQTIMEHVQTPPVSSRRFWSWLFG